jgi:solute carrier family 15 oligopeptide transporter 1
MNILLLYLPLPMFWALFDQQGSRWTFQATRMNGDIGFMTIEPDQIQVLNPLLILVFIPLYEVAFYPVLNMIGIRRPLQKLTLGGIFGGIAFILSAVIELQLEANPDTKISILWQIPQYVILTLGEVSQINQ